MQTFIDYYQLLGVSSESTEDKIKASFRKLAHLYHPDKNENSPDSKMKIILLLEAYSVLNNPEKREEYDRYLRTSRVVRKGSNKKYRTDQYQVKGKEGLSLHDVISHLNFILWEIEDIFNDKKISLRTPKYNGTLEQWLLLILHFLDRWVLSPAGYADYFFKARGLNSMSYYSSTIPEKLKAGHMPYMSFSDYFYQLRKRANQFISHVSIQDLLKPVDSKMILIDCIGEAKSMAYHYLGEINTLLQREEGSITPFVHKNPAFQ